MIAGKAILRFLGIFVLIFTLLMLPWFGFPAAYMSAFQTMVTACFSSASGQREVIWRESPDKTRPTFGRIELANRKLLKPDGSGLIRNVDLSVGSLGCTPTAMIIALVMATPIPWRRRLFALGLGTLAVQAAVMGLLAYALWNQSSEIDLVHLTPFWKKIANDWQHTFVTQFALGIPLLVWVLVTFNGKDWQKFQKGVFGQQNKALTATKRKASSSRSIPA